MERRRKSEADRKAKSETRYPMMSRKLVGTQNWRMRYPAQVGGRSKRKAGEFGSQRKLEVEFKGKSGRCNIRRKREVGRKVSGKIKWPTKDWKLVRKEDWKSSIRRKSEADPKERLKDAISEEVGS